MSQHQLTNTNGTNCLKYFNSEFEQELGRFTIKVLRVREINRSACLKQRLDVRGLFEMTEQEQLFVKFFNATAIAVKDMSDLELQAYREELGNIAIEARAKQTAVIEEDENRKKKRGRKLTELEEKSIQTDETTSNAINAIKKRSEKLGKLEKVKKLLMEMGMSEAEADEKISARGILTGNNDSKRVEPSEEIKKKIVDEVKAPARSFVNPFKKK